VFNHPDLLMPSTPRRASMAGLRTSREVQEQVNNLSRQGLGPRAIARSLGISRNTVRAILRRDPDWSDARKAPAWALTITWDLVAQDYGKGITLKSLHALYATDVTYMAFWHEFRARVPTQPEPTIRLVHKPGEKTFFDFCDGIPIIDRATGQKIKTQLLVAVLPFSSLTAGEFTVDQKQPTFVRAMENAFRRLGGVSPYVIVDNLRPAVARAHIYDPDVNRAFIEFANHMGFATLPARPYKPRDKAAVEAAIGVIQKQFFMEVRLRQFHSLAELNQTFFEYLQRLNREPMKDHGGVSREERAICERQNLKPCPTETFALAEWKSAKVHPDCHIQVERRFYSVPFQFVGMVVRVRLKPETVEIFSEDGDALALHARLKASERASTQEAHYPEQKLAAARFEVRHALKEAERTGPKTFALISSLLEGSQPLRHLRRTQGILRLKTSGQVSSPALEHASERAMLFNKKQFAYVKAAALFYEARGTANERSVMAAPVRSLNEVYLHHQPPNPLKED
jgi:transposase